jgi:hypothetical protein
LATFGLCALLYCGLQALALKRLTGVRSRALFVRLVVWICALAVIDALLAQRIRWSYTPGFPFEPVWAAIAV